MMDNRERNATLLETALPLSELSRVAAADRFSRDPAYSAHRWWARRPASTCRAILLAATMSSETPLEEFWRRFVEDEAPLRGLTVADPFAGGATSLVEARRLGADVVGADIDPLASLIASHELEGIDTGDFTRVGGDLLEFLNDQCAPYYPAVEQMAPLHYFFLRRVTCPTCLSSGLLYGSLVLARDSALAGAVVRDAELTVFCPDCLRVHHLDGARLVLACCGRRRRIDAGTFVGGKYHCCDCGNTASHRDLITAKAPRLLVAVEVTAPGSKRLIRPAEKEDVRAIELASEDLPGCGDLPIPRSPLPKNREDGRPQLYGVVSAADMFSERQLLVFGLAFHWMQERQCSPSTQRGLALALSNALATNNLFCGYATDYGRLAPLFSVRSYGMPALSVELNPLHPTGGRGTIAATIRRVARSGSKRVRRHTWDTSKQQVIGASFAGQGVGRARITTRDARAPGWRRGSVDLVLSDPPYFDYIPYSDLSQFFRAWLEAAGMLPAQQGEPLYPEDESSKDGFAKGLGRAFSVMARSLRDEGCIVFSYHSTDPRAWEALGGAISRAGLMVTSAFPVWADAKSVGHDKAGNCEWDVYFVCRRAAEGYPKARASAEAWKGRVKEFKIGTADTMSWRLAAQMVNESGRGEPVESR